MELFTLGKGYSEHDIRETARALTGFKTHWSRNGDFGGITYEADNHDPGMKKIFHKRGRFDWHDVIQLVTHHPNHAPFMVEKLWAYFITEPLDRRTRSRLVRVYRDSGLKIKPLVAAILSHPKLYAKLESPEMVKAPVVFVAGALRSTHRYIDDDNWSWLLDNMGQYPFQPPSVAGWDWGPAWLNTNTVRARFTSVNYLVQHAPLKVEDKSISPELSADEHLAMALKAVGNPWISRSTAGSLKAMHSRFFQGAKSWEMQSRADMCQRALRHLLLSGPDAQLH
jgi:uncharacterized protein (DUF1800 family)